eukprot:1196029-Prorocentrum_minimum.AAC.5
MALSTGPTDEGENVQEGGWTASSVLALAYGCFFLPAINNFLTPKLRGKHRTVQGRRWKVDYPGLGLACEDAIKSPQCCAHSHCSLNGRNEPGTRMEEAASSARPSGGGCPLGVPHVHGEFRKHCNC